MELDETYKYMGIEEGDSFDNSQMKNKLVKGYYLWVWQILKAELNSKHKITAISTLAVPVIVIGIVNWLRREIGKIDRKTRKLVTIEGIHHLKADVSRFYIKRQNGGLVSKRRLHIMLLLLVSAITLSKAKIGLHEYFNSKTKYSLQKEANLIKQKYKRQETAAQNINNQLKSSVENKKIEETNAWTILPVP